MKSKLGIPIEGFAQFSKTVASQGIVLLKNENETLPLKKEEKIAIFGRCQIEYYRSGTGSGGAVNVLYNTNILDSFPAEMVNQDLAQQYRQFIQENPFDNGGGGWACEPWSQKELELTPEMVENAKKTSEKAIVILGRTAGEDKDNLDVAGSYRLTPLEETMLAQVTAVFSKVCVVLNISNIIDMSWTEKYAVDSILCSWNGGMEGGGATVEVLLGNCSPSGKLPNTIAQSIEDYGSTANHGGVERNVYQEDIYVGYRYFSTFAPEKVLYPFGFGLSYSQFSLSDITCKDTGDFSFEISALVKNTGKQFSGKEVLQVYLHPPQGKLGKPSRNLVGFAKTKELSPQESETLTISIPQSRLTSFDDSGVTGAVNAYVLEPGDYEFYIGTDVTATEKRSFTVDSLLVTSQLTQALAPIYPFTRMKPSQKKEDGSYTMEYEAVPTATVDMTQRIKENIPPEIPFTGDTGIKLVDVAQKKAKMQDFIAQLSPAELCTLVCGEGMSHPQVTPGTASAFAGVTAQLRDFGIPLICCADGPSGIRMEGGLKSTQVPIGTLLAATWDLPLIQELYHFTGQEMAQNFVDVLLGPGMNIHRNPLNGRNFEYFSEDPLLTGLMASSVAKGIKKSGVSATLKHFACNSQETHRHSIDSVVSQRAVREIYLKCFELAVTGGDVDSIMTAYNPINSIWTASNYDLNTSILRGEWGYTGFVMTDWWARMNDPISGGEGCKDNLAAMVKAQNDVYMILNNFDAVNYANVTNLKTAVDTGYLSVAELQRCAINICQFAMESNAMNRDFSLMAEQKTMPSQALDHCDCHLSGKETSQSIENNQGFSFHCPEPGDYEIYMDFQLDTTALAQVFFQLKLNQESAAVMLTGDTKGKVISKKICDLKLEQGGYALSLEVGSDTFYVKTLRIIKS